ncbi:sensor histidine kinase [Alloiococcus sp. CFN-8]|uniref:sensor histidine kinase n=1 Tax=Alloiococcus sp. CFN-8 TaxID=3416081 RepID=UPI003CF152A2
MKNKEALKIALLPLVYMILSGIITYVIYNVIAIIIEFLYQYTTLQLINLIMRLQYRYPGGTDFVQGTVVVATFITSYLLLMRNSAKRLSGVIRGVEEMASGELNLKLQEAGEDTIGKLAGNINKIVYDLKNITLEEKRAQQTKSDLITNVSHDLRTPLTSIMGYLSLIEEDKYRDEVQLRHYVAVAYDKAKSLRVLIEDLFELTKMQNYTMKLEKQEIDIVEMLGQVVSQYQLQLEKYSMEARVDFTEDRLIILADPNKLVRAFDNLITNAMRYGREGRYIDIAAKREGAFALLQFVNYGEEISSMDIPYIFDRFYRVEKSRSRNSGGSGLGLAITKNIVELHEGHIGAKSEDGRTVFEITLPLSSD